MRHEVLVDGRRDLARLAMIGLWMSTFANADGTSITVSREKIATLCGVAPETVSRAYRALKGVGLIRGRRRPNKAAEHVLTIPIGSGPLDWDTWLPEFTESRQRLAHRRKKAAEMEAVIAEMESRSASVDAVADGVHGRCPDGSDSVRGCVPDGVRGGCSEDPDDGPDSVRGRYRMASMDAVRMASVAGGTMSYLPPVVTSTEDLDTGSHSPQPQVGVATLGEKIDSPGEERWGCGTKQCARCGGRMANRSDRAMCVACLREDG